MLGASVGRTFRALRIGTVPNMIDDGTSLDKFAQDDEDGLG